MVPGPFERITDELHEIVSAVRHAAECLQRGDPGLAAHLSWVAIEGALIWAMRLEGMDLRGEDPGHKHTLRVNWSTCRLALREEDVWDAYRFSTRRRYRFEHSAKGGKPIGTSEAEAAILRAIEWILGVARFTQTLTEGQYRTLEQNLSPSSVFSAHVPIEALEEVATSGNYRSPMAKAFQAMVWRYSHPHTQQEFATAATLAYYAGHQTANQGICSGPNNSFMWTDLARRWGRHSNDRERLAHLKRLDSIGHELRGNPAGAMRSFEEFREYARGLPHLRSTVINREARVAAYAGQFHRAEDAAREALLSADDPTDRATLARRHLTLGMVAGRQRDHKGAIARFEAGLALHQSHQMITKCNGALYLMEACRQAGDLDKAEHYARMCQTIANRYDYPYHIGRVERFNRWLHGPRQ